MNSMVAVMDDVRGLFIYFLKNIKLKNKKIKIKIKISARNQNIRSICQYQRQCLIYHKSQYTHLDTTLRLLYSRNHPNLPYSIHSHNRQLSASGTNKSTSRDMESQKYPNAKKKSKKEKRKSSDRHRDC